MRECDMLKYLIANERRLSRIMLYVDGHFKLANHTLPSDRVSSSAQRCCILERHQIGKDLFMGEGQKFVKFLISSPIYRLSILIVLIFSVISGIVAHQLIAGCGVTIGWFLGMEGIYMAAWAYDRKQNKTT